MFNFTQQIFRFSKMYIKSTAHHFPREKLSIIFEVNKPYHQNYACVKYFYLLQGIRSQFLPGGRLLIDSGPDSCSLPWGDFATKYTPALSLDPVPGADNRELDIEDFGARSIQRYTFVFNLE